MQNNKIHSTAIIDDNVILNEGVEIGPYSIIKGPCKIGKNTIIQSHVVIYSDVVIGDDCNIFPFAVIGGVPQDLKYKSEKSRIFIGNGTIIREHVTVHKGTAGGIMETYIGKNCLIMGSAHIAHDCFIGDDTIISHNALIGGHVIIGHGAVIGGLAAIHQNVRIGHNAIIGGGSLVNRDIIPYGNVYGLRSTLNGINIVGMRRRNFPTSEIDKTIKLYKFLFKPNNDEPKLFSQRIKMALKEDFGKFGREILQFVQEKSLRSLCTNNEKDDND
ncbi:acyl-ACP--UDP-N-acetylglucosamine O-acyltransferase [Lyticum sinuosum]|uniref:Acyl-[acyl-carrier-protein]--UDP-N-acetylglucosamine O-acyltransferase n=1 Tax=Lyticum sinuosum TaxID=1332059 RepID=A0AAE4VK51_9RICK|nr:acyl-ACP--UDP-N-acetylglucosamine O-acyltransferase [Lyticum sinuosum]MDZ5761000.1 Acyl-[acyl-carrier-protein]--UDP-N-acetylglucosamine O-acyltransferase [Lyticum sinuosum]